MYVYIIRCSDNKYYVGKTRRNPDVRFIEHLDGSGSEWTKKYTPIELLESYETDDSFKEDQMTKQYMMKYGIDSVRGGSYTKLILEEWQIKTLEHEFVSMNDLCYKCGKTGHFANNCITNKYSEYLSRFTTQEEIVSVLDELEKFREKLVVGRVIIENMKYVKYRDGQHILELCVCPETINKYYMEIKDYQEKNPNNGRNSSDTKPFHYLVHHAREIVTNPNNMIKNSSNSIELLYKIYIRWVSISNELCDDISDNLGYDDEYKGEDMFGYYIIKANTIIELLYEKYANLI